jgi:hypothetical protein
VASKLNRDDQHEIVSEAQEGPHEAGVCCERLPLLLGDIRVGWGTETRHTRRGP